VTEPIVVIYSTPTGSNHFYEKLVGEFQYPEERNINRGNPRHIIDQHLKGATMSPDETPVVLEELNDLIAEANEQSRTVFPTTAELSEEQIKSQNAKVEQMITQLMKTQNISRGKAKRALQSIHDRAVKKMGKARSKQIMAIQNRRDQGLPDIDPLSVGLEDETLMDLLDGVNEENTHYEVLTGEPVGNELV
jgi:hypothetical protein